MAGTAEEFELAGWRADRARRFDDWLRQQFPPAWPEGWDAALTYPAFGGGKRVRPLLAIAAYEALGGDRMDPVFPGAAAVELIHTYSLVHDDLPCMDDDDERRGRPTVHVKWDETTAVLVGDALLTHAFSVLADAPLPADRVVASVRWLARAAGYLGMVGGQVADTGFPHPPRSLQEVTRTHRLKTGALITAATVLGGIAAGARPEHERALEVYGAAVGLAFQLADDVLDADEDAGEDGPPSFVRLLGVAETRRRAQSAVSEAIAAIADLPRPEALVALARYTVERTH